MPPFFFSFGSLPPTSEGGQSKQKGPTPLSGYLSLLLVENTDMPRFWVTSTSRSVPSCFVPTQCRHLPATLVKSFHIASLWMMSSTSSRVWWEGLNSTMRFILRFVFSFFRVVFHPFMVSAILMHGALKRGVVGIIFKQTAAHRHETCI